MQTYHELNAKLDSAWDAWGATESIDGQWSRRDSLFALFSRHAIRAFGIEWNDSEMYSTNEHAFLLRNKLCGLLSLFDPALSKEFDGKIAITKNRAEYDRSRRAVLKPGRAFRAIFPWASDSVVEQFVDTFRAHCPVEKLTLVISKEQSEFRRAYIGEIAPFQNPQTTFQRKNLATSCMRHGFTDLPYHPAEAYASGDFTIAIVQDAQERIAGRVVIYDNDGTPHAAPMYGVSEQALNMLESYLESINAESDESWQGARLLALEHCGDFIAPYLDCEPRAANVNGRFLEVCHYGELELDSTDGVARQEDLCRCEDCGDRIDYDDSYSDSHGFAYCESCYFERFTFCESCEDTIARDDCTSVYHISRYGVQTETHCDHCAHAYAIYCDDGEYWREDSCTYIEDEGIYVDNVTLERDYFLCDNSGEYVENKYRAELETGETVDLRELDLDIWQPNNAGIYFRAMESLFDELPEHAAPCRATPSDNVAPHIGAPLCLEWRATVDAIRQGNMRTSAMLQTLMISEMRARGHISTY